MRCQRHLLLTCIISACLLIFSGPLIARSSAPENNEQYALYLPLVIRPIATDQIQQRVIDLTNDQRRQNGCPPLTASVQLTSAAQVHSEDMATHDFFSHTGSDGSAPWDRMQRAGYDFTMAAENIAAGMPTPQEVVEAWMRSTGHRANILNCELREIGIGYVYQADDQPTVRLSDGSLSGPFYYYWTQDFGTR